jgi:hypothetical protein
MTTPSPPRALILAAVAVASSMLAPSLPAAAAGQRPSAAAHATVYANPNRIIRDHRRDARCKWTGRHYCSLKQPPL